MKQIIIGLLLALLFVALVVAASLLRTLKSTSLFELKNRLKQKDKIAGEIYSVFTYRVQVSWLAKATVVISQLSLVIILAWSLWAPFSIAIVAGIILIGGYGINYLLSIDQTEKITALSAPYIVQIVTFLSPATEFLRKVFVRRPTDISLPFHSKEELIDIVKRSESAIRVLTSDERGIVGHALTFGDKIIGDVMVPRRVVKGVSVEAQVNIKLLKNLHDSGFSRFPVFEGDLDHIVGTLYLKDLVGQAKTNVKKIKDICDSQVYFVNQNKTLNHALNAFLRTKHHLFIVVNEFEEMTGVITIEDIIEQMMGRKIIDEFDRYDDLREVAALQAKKDRQKHKDPT